MSLRGWSSKTITDPRGAWTRLDGIEARPERATLARNVRFEPLRVKTREGYIQALPVAGKVGSMYFWSSNVYGIGQLDRLLYYQGGALKWWDFRNSETHTLFTQAGVAASVAEAGNKVYAAVFNSTGVGAGQARAIQAPYDSNGVIVDKAFAGPLSNNFTVAETGAGQCSLGVHHFGVIMESRSGYSGPPGPAPGGTFAPVSFDVTADGRALRLTMTLTPPAHAAYLHAIMTRQDSLNRWYYVPGATISLSPGVPGAVYIDINISDDDLASTATLADGSFNYLAQDSSGVGPFNPSAVAALGRRMAYFVRNKVYVSEIDNYEVITEDQHVLQVPGQKVLTIGFQQRGSIYLLGPAGTWATVDNGDVPRLWSAPLQVSELLGTTAVHGVCPRTAGDFTWVANEAGLFMFDGRYSTRPISYMNEPEWRRINWASPGAVFVKDDVVRQRVHVAAPLDGATEGPTHILTWGYNRGMTPETVDFSLDDFTSGAFGSIELVKDTTTNQTKVWVAPAAVGYVLKADDTAHTDNGAAINSVWHSGLVLGKKERVAHEHRFGGVDLDISGAGQLKTTMYGKGSDEVQNLDDVNLEVPPVNEPQLMADMVSENVTVKLETAGAGEHFDVSVVTVYHRAERW